MAEIRQLISESLLPHFHTIDLESTDYQTALNLVVARLLPSGAIYDALIETAARKWRARRLITLNRSDFARLSDKPDDWLLDPRFQPPT